MEKLLLVIALACLPGDRLIDLSSKIPCRVRSMDFVVSLEPFYTRFYICQPGFPDSFQHCCGGKPSGSYGYRSSTDASASDKASHK
jgi:hypothetical protein